MQICQVKCTDDSDPEAYVWTEINSDGEVFTDSRVWTAPAIIGDFDNEWEITAEDLSGGEATVGIHLLSPESGDLSSGGAWIDMIMLTITPTAAYYYE